MKILTKILASFSLSLLILFSAFFYVMDLDAFYNYEIEKNNIEAAVDIPKEELLPLYKVLTDYMVGSVDSIQLEATVSGQVMPMYNQREIDHMVDVRHLIDLLKGLIMFLVLLLAISLLVLVRKKEKITSVFIGQFISTILIFMGFVGMAMTDFNKYFIKFHEIFFTNDLWLLNPLTDRMIMLLPEVFFRDIVLVIVMSYGFVSLFLAITGTIFDKKMRKVIR